MSSSSCVEFCVLVRGTRAAAATKHEVSVAWGTGIAVTGRTTKGGAVYIGGGVLVLILIVLLLIWLL
jgi:hypothetical protein